MSLENIIDRILKDASVKVAALKKDTTLNSADFLKKAEEEAGTLKGRILKEANARAQAEMEHSYIAKNLEIKKELLKKKREFIDTASEEAFNALLALDDKKYMDILKNVIRAQVKDNTEYEIQFSKKDSNRINKDFIEALNRKGLNLKLGKYLDIDDLGFLLRKDKVILDFTFLKTLKALKEKMQFEVTKILFE